MTRPAPAHRPLNRLISLLSGWESATRTSSPEKTAALALRWAELPAAARTPAQLLGRAAVGCEGTHGVFPRCNLTCSPCYHSADANKVTVDGGHTVREVKRQMALLRTRRGPRAHAQLIGGEVTLLDPDAHAEALLAMRAAGREPMSMTHGDFDPDYLEALVSAPDGSLRLPRVSFAAHFDSLMRGRRGAVRPRSEAELNGHRRAFVAMFEDLRARKGLRSYLAHNMTVTADNLPEVGRVAREVSRMGYQMMSFQPAALVGDDRRWPADGRGIGIDDVWAELEAGLGQRLPCEAVQFGDPRCNRTAIGVMADTTWVPLLDPSSPRDLAARDLYLSRYGGLSLDASRPGLIAATLVRAFLRRPWHAAPALGWALRVVRRAGGPVRVARCLTRGEISALTLVVHAFMDADVVAAAQQATAAGVTAEEPNVRAAQERLAACSYHMAHPDTGELVPACVQHSVLDPDENKRLAVLLSMPRQRPGIGSSGSASLSQSEQVLEPGATALGQPATGNPEVVARVQRPRAAREGASRLSDPHGGTGVPSILPRSHGRDRSAAGAVEPPPAAAGQHAEGPSGARARELIAQVRDCCLPEPVVPGRVGMGDAGEVPGA
ncbi:Radical SAM domain protein [Nocardioides sp. JS614]|nr:Radical SAM domain protein [Nocardioides sp. JS614]